MEGKIIKPKNTKKNNLISTVIILILGIVLVTNSNQIVTIAFQIIGAFITLYGIYRLIQYFNLKKQFKTDDNAALISGIIAITIGLLTILLAGIIEVGLRYILGIYLLINGLSKITTALEVKNTNSQAFITYLIEGIILLGLGLYTIFFANAALIIVGILLIISSVMDLFAYLNSKN